MVGNGRQGTIQTLDLASPGQINGSWLYVQVNCGHKPVYLCRVHFENGHWDLFDEESAL